MTSVAKPDWPAEAEFAAPGNPFQYSVYGLHVESEVRLSLTEDSFESPADVSLVVAESACFEQASAGVRLLPDEETWYRHAFLRDGRVYLRWEGLFEFVVGADGRQVLMASLGAETMESFQVYLLGHALGFALTLMGEEPLHATAVEANGKCVGLLGSSGAGKSTTAAYLLGRGARLVTDDVLRVTIEGNHARVHPGPQRIKLLPEAKQAFMAEAAHGVEMNPGSGKHIVALPAGMKHERTAILDGLFLLDWPRDGEPEPKVEKLAAREGFLGVIAGTFNLRVKDPRRLERQFRFAEKLVQVVPVRRLVYLREFDRLPEVARLMGFA